MKDFLSFVFKHSAAVENCDSTNIGLASPELMIPLLCRTRSDKAQTIRA